MLALVSCGKEIKEKTGAEITIEDDGKGFEVTGKKSKGIGLKNIGERAKLLKAEFMITGKFNWVVVLYAPR